MQDKNIIILVFCVLISILAGSAFVIFCSFDSRSFNGQLNKSYDWVKTKIEAVFGPPSGNINVAGGVRLEYRVDLSYLSEREQDNAIAGLRDLIGRRVFANGIIDPVVRFDSPDIIIVELPGATDTQKAIEWVGASPPSLRFLESRSAEETASIINSTSTLENPYFKETELTEKYLKNAALVFDATTEKPLVDVEFDSQGAVILEKVTERNVGKPLAVFLDGKSIVDTNGDGVIDESDLYAPLVAEKVSGGRINITGIASVQEAKTIVKRLDESILPISLGQPVRAEIVAPASGQN